MLPLFDSSPLIQNSKFNDFLWICWFLGKFFIILYPTFENSTTHIAIMYRQPTAAADKMTDMPELHSGQIMWLNPRFLNHFSQDLSVTMCHFWKCKQLFLIACNPFFHTLYVFMILCMKHLIKIEVAFHQSFLTGKTLFQNVI